MYIVLSLFLSVTDTLQVIYSLNMKNEEQEASLQALSHAHHEELHHILMETCHEGDGSVLRTRLLELQESLDEQQRVGAQVCACVSPCVCVCVCVCACVCVYVQALTFLII